MMIIFLLTIFVSFQTILSDQSLGKGAEHILNSVEYVMPAPSIIGKHEWEELQLDRLVTILDRTTTSFGRWGLVQLLHPIADQQELMHRKQIITFLIEHEKEMHIFQEQLKQVHNVEKSLIAYWDKYDQLNQSSQRFYFSAIGLSDLNKNNIALAASTVLEGFNAFKDLLQMFALMGVAEEFTRWSLGAQEEFDWMRGLRAGLMDPIMRHSPWLYKLGSGPYTDRDAARAASWGDAYNVFKGGFSYKRSGKIVQSPSLGGIGAFLAATATTLFFDYQWLNRADSSIKRIVSMNRDLNDLQKRVADVAHGVQAIKKLRAMVVKQAPELADYFGDDGDSAEDLTKKLLIPRFLKKPGLFYSRGHVLGMHREIAQKRKTLVPLLQSVALLDAYCSIAQLYKEFENKEVRFVFPEFVESKTPLVEYHDAWLPLLPAGEAVTNNLVLGGGHPGKIVITGPNGGGKSTILKTFIAPILAQSWGIVPAKVARQTIFAEIRTNIASGEDLERGLSRGMAGIKIMDELLQDIQESNNQQGLLVLIDEPYSGMVDVEAAKRIYQFGKKIAPYSQALVVMATHTQKPIELAQEMPNIFANYQVKINEKRLGIFERLFKLEPGPALWWFNDEGKRGRFVDWISLKSSAKK
jgi:hypothetical protein